MVKIERGVHVKVMLETNVDKTASGVGRKRHTESGVKVSGGGGCADKISGKRQYIRNDREKKKED